MLNSQQILRNHIVHSAAVRHEPLSAVNARLELVGIKPVRPGTWELIVTRYAPLARKAPVLLHVFTYNHVGLGQLRLIAQALAADLQPDPRVVPSTVRSRTDEAA